MASCRKSKKKSFFTWLGFFLLIGFPISIFCNGWDPENCPSFCQCLWLYGLKWADCTDHRLYSVQTGVDENVQALDLSNNSISSLANYELREAGLTRLKLLNLSSNGIKEIGLMAFIDLSQLKVLDLSKNHLYFILPETFVKNLKLEIVDLAGNNLNQHVPKLQSSSIGSLDLSNCGISHLPSNTFNGLPRLRALDLTDNVIIEIGLDMLKELPNLKVLMLERNPWSCNSNMHELQKRLEAREVMFKRICNDNKSMESSNVPKKFEKMIAAENPTTVKVDGGSRLLVRLKNWKNSLKMDKTLKKCQPHVITTEVIKNQTIASNLAVLSPYWSLAIGFILGSAISIVCTYFWLTSTITTSATNSQRRDPIENEALDIANQRVHLLQHLWQFNDDTNASTNSCPGTPPPPYRDVMLYANRYPRPDIRAQLFEDN